MSQLHIRSHTPGVTVPSQKHLYFMGFKNIELQCLSTTPEVGFNEQED